MGRVRRVSRGLLLRAGAGIAVAGLIGTVHPFVVMSAEVGAVPLFGVDTVSKDAEVTYTDVDTLTTPIDAAVVEDGSSSCFGNGETGNGCFDRISSMVTRHGAAAGFTANYNNGIDILGLAVVNHHAYSPPDPNTTSLCVGDALPGQTRPTITITKDANATVCRTAVSGERLVAGGKVSIEGQGQDGKRGAFWWSVEENSPVQRTLLGVKPDGSLLVAVVTARRSGVRDGMTLENAATWMIAHGVTDAIATDGGHQAEVYVAGRGAIVPFQAGEPLVQVSLLLDRTVPILPPPPPTQAPTAVPASATAGATPGSSGSGTDGGGHQGPASKPPLPGTGALGSVVMPALPESGVVPPSGASPDAGAAGGLDPDSGLLPTPPGGDGPPSSGDVTGLTAW